MVNSYLKGLVVRDSRNDSCQVLGTLPGSKCSISGSSSIISCILLLSRLLLLAELLTKEPLRFQDVAQMPSWPYAPAGSLQPLPLSHALPATDSDAAWAPGSRGVGTSLLASSSRPCVGVKVHHPHQTHHLGVVPL